MIRLLLRIILAAGAFWAASYLLPGFHVDSAVDALKGAIALGILNAVIRPVVGFFALPITLLTLGLFGLVINGAMVWLADTLLAGIRVDSFGWAVVAAVVISVVNAVGHRLLK